jgi:hypothetical protein
VTHERCDGDEVLSIYSPGGHREVMQSLRGARSVMWYDARGALEAMGIGGVDTIEGAHLRIERDAAGLEQRRLSFGGVALTTQRDRAGRPSARSLEVRDAQGHVRDTFAERWTWRGDDQLAEHLDTLRGARRFEHDASGRLVREVTATGALDRSFDGEGNVFGNPLHVERTYTSDGMMMRSERGTYTYDALGQRLSWTRNPAGRSC